MEATPTTATEFETGKPISRTEAAERMYGTGSKQHLAAIKKWGTK